MNGPGGIVVCQCGHTHPAHLHDERDPTDSYVAAVEHGPCGLQCCECRRWTP